MVMEKSLVIVESPAKAKTINKYLGSEYVVKASMGHIRDLPKSKLGVDVENNFTPLYDVIPERKKLVSELKQAAQDASRIILAADPDREGEAICWHLKALLDEGQKPVHRLKLHEITKPAVEEAIRHMTDLDQNMFDAQQARRVLDRLVGYLISPLLWKKVARGLSAGRVQSIAMRIIYEREKEILAFKPEEYWTIFAHLASGSPPPFRAALAKIDGKKAKIGNQAEADAVLSDLKEASYVLGRIKVREKKRNPSAPFITSTLQQESYQRLRYPVKKTMSVAQKLYEGMAIGDRGPVGLITYMRTDSVRVSPEAVAWARQYIEKTFSARHLPAHPNTYANKNAAQDAHEAIRPTSPELTPEVVKPYLKREEFNLYSLIWNRFLASQMSPAQIEETEFEITAAKKYLFSAKGEVLKFAGFLALTVKEEVEKPEDADEGSDDDAEGPAKNGSKSAVTLPAAREGETLTLKQIEPKQSFTQPPARFTEGTLVKELEAKGIGRPSTYAPIISTLQNRTYVVKIENKFRPTELGLFVTEFLIKNFPDIMEIRFTAGMEEELDKIEEGKMEWTSSLKEFYAKLDIDLKAAMKVESVKATGIPLNESCPKCSKPVVLKSGKFGSFKACSRLRLQGSHGQEGSRRPGREVPRVRREPRPAPRPLRPLHCLLQLSDLQVHQEKEDRGHGHRLPQLRRRHHPQARNQAGPFLLRLQHVPQVPLRHLGRAPKAALSQVRQALHPAPQQQEGRDLPALPGRELRLEGSPGRAYNSTQEGQGGGAQGCKGSLTSFSNT
jgi:DNA topoisomerase-1